MTHNQFKVLLSNPLKAVIKKAQARKKAAK
jgi:hypothetical protein